jgi:tripartite-type tricarboxylate transporter receptor subunit TctC
MPARLIASIIAFWLTAVASAAAQSYPDKPIRFIVTFPPGGSTDVVARALQPALERALGQSIIIENRPGAGGVIGLDAVAKAAPDGYTIGMGAAGALVINVSLQEKMPYDPLKDLAPISKVAESPFILAATPAVKANSLRDLIALAKSAPDSVAIGHGGNGTAMHLTAQMFNAAAGVKLAMIPYRGTAAVVTDLVGGHVALGIVDPPPSTAALRSGQIKPIAISSKGRFAMFPDIPTFQEQGFAGFESTGWFGIVVPAGTPPAIIARLNTAVVGALHYPEVTERIRGVGMEPTPMTPAEFGSYIRGEIEKFSKVVAVSGARN